MVQLFVRSLDSSSLAFDVDAASDVRALKAQIEAREGIPSTSQGLVYAGRQLADEAQLAACGIESGSTLHLVLRLRGGKGGFGALLRGQGRDGKITNNFDACRDLQGRRLRHQKTEQQLAEWQSQARERELEKIAQKHIRDMAKQARRDAKEQDSEKRIAQVAEEQKKAAESVQDALQAALKHAHAEGTAAGGSGKRKADDAGAGSSGAGSAAAAKPAAKKSKMLACLEEVDDSSDSDEGSE